LDLSQKLGNRSDSGLEIGWTLADRKSLRFNGLELEAPPGFEPGMEVLQISQGWLCC